MTKTIRTNEPLIEEEQEHVCEGCGGELTSKMLDDEIYDQCTDCGLMNFS